MNRLGVGIIGFGRIGNEHAQWLSTSIRALPVAVADATVQRRRLAQQQGLKAYATSAELLADADVEAAVVATPTAMHFEHAQAALHAGKHVLVEKPMALNREQAQQLASLAAEQGKVISVFQNRRWDIDYLTLKKAVDAGVFGKVINVESRLGQWSSCVGPAAPEYRPGWRNELAFGGGGLFDWGSHFVDQIWQLLLPARPVRVFAQLRGNVWSTDCDDFARVCIDYDSGAVAVVEINTTTTRPLPRWHIDGTAGSADSPFSDTFDTHQWAQFHFTPADGSAEQLLPLASSGLSFPAIWDAFAAACAGEGKPAVEVESVLVTMQLLDAARQSSETGKVVELLSP